MVRVTKKIFKVLNKKQRALAVIIVFMMLIGGIMESLSVSLILPLISAVTDESGWERKWYAKLLCNCFAIDEHRVYIEVLLLLLVAVFMLKNVFLLFEYYVQFAFISKSRYKLQHELMHSYVYKPYKFFISASSGEIIRIITSDTSQAFQLLSSVFTFYTELIVGVIISITIFAMNPQIAIGLVVLLLLELLLIARVIKPIMKRLGLVQRKESAITNKWILQAINGIKSIKVSHTEGFFENNYSYHAQVYVDADRKYLTISTIPRLIIEAFTVAGVLFMMYFMVILGADLNSIIPQLSAFVVAAIRLLPCINRISGAVNQVPFFEGGLDNVLKVMNGDNSYDLNIRNERIPDVRITDYKLNKEILFDDISFRYMENGSLVFDNASFSVRKGESVGIIGPSGAGKTTALDILMGLLSPCSGRILVDGKDIKDNMEMWLSNLSYIPQSIFLMDDTIRANVAFGYNKSEINDDDVWRALDEAQMKDYVISLQDGLDTMVGERGMRLSGGQQQRIGIARALFKNPEVLVFDEATSALDNDTEAAIMESIEKLRGQKTMIIVAHRLSTIKDCDVVYKVENGKIHKEEVSVQ